MYIRTVDPVKKEETKHLEGFLLEDVRLFSNEQTSIKHGLGRTPRGWIVTDRSNDSIIFRKKPFNPETLVLESTKNTTISIWVY